MLQNFFGRTRPPAIFGGGRGMSPMTLALLGTLAYRTLKGKGRLADILNTGPQPRQDDIPSAMQVRPRDVFSPSSLSDGLANLLNRFRVNGFGSAADSWISSGPNKPLPPRDIERALGPDRIDWLVQQTGLPREDLLAGLSRELPHAVDQLTPDGHLPNEQEIRRLM